MKITKFEHACFIAEQDGQSLIVDPGSFTTNLVIPDNVVGVMITHEHTDHFDRNHLQEIIAKNPEVLIVAHSDITSQLDGFKTQAVVPNEAITLGNFKLEFFGGEHAVIFEGQTVIANLGVLINQKLYYPGDSFVAPNQPVEVLALPISAPWLKVNETVTYLEAVKPSRVFPTHDAILSDTGKALLDRMLVPVTEKLSASYQRLTESIEI